MRLTGRLEDHGLEKILLDIHENQWYGTLHLQYEDRQQSFQEAYLLFSQGRILTCHKAQKSENLATELIQLDILAPDKIQTGLSLCQQRDERVEKVLLEMGFIEKESLFRAYEKILSRRLAQYIYQMGEEGGTYSFKRSEGGSEDIAMPDLALGNDELFIPEGLSIPPVLENLVEEQPGSEADSLKFSNLYVHQENSEEDQNSVENDSIEVEVQINLEMEEDSQDSLNAEDQEISGTISDPPGSEPSGFIDLSRELGLGEGEFPKLDQDELGFLSEMLGELNQPEQIPDISFLILRFASQVFVRGVLWKIEGSELKNIGEFGFVSEDLDASGSSKSKLSLDSSEIFRDIVTFRKIFKEKVDSHVLAQKFSGFFDALKGSPPSEVFLAPIQSRDCVTAIFYGDQGTNSMLSPKGTRRGNIAAFEIFLGQVGIAMEKKFLMERLEKLEKGQ